MPTGILNKDIEAINPATKENQDTVIGRLNDVQYPVPTDSDSVYVKDIDVANSDNGNFSGEVTDYFDSLKTVNSDATANNPKTIKVWFKRTIYSHAIGFGCDDLTKGFGTSITVKLLGSGEAVRFEKTYTPTDLNSFLAEFGPKAFNGVLLEFNTTDEVCLSNLTIGKSLETNASLQGLDPSGAVQSVAVTADGNLSISDNSTGLVIAQGNVTGASNINKFGNAPSFGTGDGEVDVWDGADAGNEDLMNYTFSTTADIDRLSSSDNTDTQDIEVFGLDANYNAITQTITLTGQTPVSLTTSLVRLFRMSNVGSTNIAGRVYCFVNGATTLGVPDTLTDIRAIIDNGNNQTEMAIYTVPAGKTGYIRELYASTAGASKTTNYVMKMKIRPFNQVFQLRHRRTITDTKDLEKKFDTPEVVPEKSDIIVTTQALETGVSGAGVIAGFDVVLIDN